MAMRELERSVAVRVCGSVCVGVCVWELNVFSYVNLFF